MAALTFLGGTGSVTGSKFLVEHAGHRVLVDCGLYQGLRELRALNWEPLPIDPSTIDAVVITHAHLDHSGYLPRLARQGFAGPVVCTRDTAALATIVLRDSAYLQEEEAAYARRAGFSKHSPPLPLYASDDAERVIGLLRHVDFGSAQPLADDIDVELNPAGHILGSATALLDVGGRRVLFSGDLGRPSHPLLAPPAPPPPADVIVVESTYGDRGHGAPDTALLASAVRRTVRRGGVVLVAASPSTARRSSSPRWHASAARGRSPPSRSMSTARWRSPRSRSIAGPCGRADRICVHASETRSAVTTSSRRRRCWRPSSSTLPMVRASSSRPQACSRADGSCTISSTSCPTHGTRWC